MSTTARPHMDPLLVSLAEGFAMIGLKKTLGRGSLAHEYWKRFYAASFREQGYDVQLEAPRRNGRVDVLARKGDESLAVEIETGLSNPVWNVKQDLLAGFGKVLVVATDLSTRVKSATPVPLAVPPAIPPRSPASSP